MDYRLPVVAVGDGSLALVNPSFVKRLPVGLKNTPCLSCLGVSWLTVKGMEV